MEMQQRMDMDMDNGELGGRESAGRMTEIQLCYSSRSLQAVNLASRTHTHTHFDSDRSLDQKKHRYASS